MLKHSASVFAKVNERLTNCLCHQEPRVVCVNTCDRRKQNLMVKSWTWKEQIIQFPLKHIKGPFDCQTICWCETREVMPFLLCYPSKCHQIELYGYTDFCFCFKYLKLTCEIMSSVIMFQIFFFGTNKEKFVHIVMAVVFFIMKWIGTGAVKIQND